MVETEWRWAHCLLSFLALMPKASRKRVLGKLEIGSKAEEHSKAQGRLRSPLLPWQAAEGEPPESLFRWLRWGWLPLVGGSVLIVIGVMLGWELFDPATANARERISFSMRGLVASMLMAIWAGFYVAYARRRIRAVHTRLRREGIALAERAWRAEQSIGMAALSRILAHEIRNPLNGMALNGALLKRKLLHLQGGDELVPIADTLAFETARLAHLVDDYLVYTQAKRIELSLAPVDLGKLAREMIESQQPALEAANVVVEIAMADDLPHPRADSAKLRQAFHNLLRNAVEAMPQGGCVRIEMHRDETGVVLVVSDDGPGFEAPEAVLRPFYTTKPEGSGLGLAIVRDIVRAHGGEIRARNLSPQGGAEVFLKLPLREASA